MQELTTAFDGGRVGLPCARSTLHNPSLRECRFGLALLPAPKHTDKLSATSLSVGQLTLFSVFAYQFGLTQLIRRRSLFGSRLGGGRGTGIEPSPHGRAYSRELQLKWFLAKGRLSMPYDLILGFPGVAAIPRGRLYNSAPANASDRTAPAMGHLAPHDPGPN